jgi:hypothetical protein
MTRKLSISLLYHRDELIDLIQWTTVHFSRLWTEEIWYHIPQHRASYEGYAELYMWFCITCSYNYTWHKLHKGSSIHTAIFNCIAFLNIKNCSLSFNSVTNSMNPSPSWEGNGYLDTPEIPSLLWNLNGHYRVHMGPPMFPFLSQMNSVHNYLSHFLKINFNNILPPTPISS